LSSDAAIGLWLALLRSDRTTLNSSYLEISNAEVFRIQVDECDRGLAMSRTPRTRKAIFHADL